MHTIPDICIEYTEVFQTMRLEMGLCIVVGVLIGYFFDRINK